MFFHCKDKHTCSACGCSLSLFERPHIADGCVCGSCLQKLSYWFPFEARRKATAADITSQLTLRAANSAALRDFHPTRHIACNFHLYIEEKDGAPYRFVVSEEEDYAAANADLLLFADVASVGFHVEQRRTSLNRKDASGREMCRIGCDFTMKVRVVDQPYFDTLEFQLNPHTVDIELPAGEDPASHPDYRKYHSLYEEFAAMAEAAHA